MDSRNRYKELTPLRTFFYNGFTAMIGVFISTFLICTSSVMVNLVSGAYSNNIPASEMAKGATIMTQNGFASGFGLFGRESLRKGLTITIIK